MRNIGRFLSVILVISLIVCNSKPQEELKILEFQVTDSLLDSLYTNSLLGMNFSPPRSCAPLCDSMMQEVVRRTASLWSDSITGKIRQVFFSSENQIYCFLSAMQCPPDSLMDSLWLNQAERLSKLQPNSTQFSDHFRYKDFRIRQMIVTNPEWVMLKLLFLRPSLPTFQLDYLVPASVYHDLGHALESSIGSVEACSLFVTPHP